MLEPLPALQTRKQPTILQLAVEKQTQGQHRKAKAALQRAKENRTAATERYMAMAAPADLQHSQPPVPALMGNAHPAANGSQAAPAQGNWLLQSMSNALPQQTIQLPCVAPVPAPEPSVASRSTKQLKRRMDCSASKGSSASGIEHRQSARTGRIVVPPRRFDNCFVE
jgi:hypothetical protein